MIVNPSLKKWKVTDRGVGGFELDGSKRETKEGGDNDSRWFKAYWVESACL